MTERAEHTSGPWEFELDETSSGTMFAVYDKNGSRVTDAYIHESAARLIAAAPDLLAKLVEIRKWMDADVCGPWDAKFISEIDALVAKATGEA